MAATKQELDKLAAQGCAKEGCTHETDNLSLHGSCHPGGKIEASYNAGKGTLRVGCKECGADIVEVKVAEK